MRIVAGTARGRRIAVPSGTTTRPTTDRVREAMFSTLTSVLTRRASTAADGWSDVRVVDMCAGSGALGLEALSRGARSSVFIESDRKVASVLRSNIHVICERDDHDNEASDVGRSQSTQVLVGDAWSIVRQPAKAATGLIPAHLLFIDAPYETSTADIRTLVASAIEYGWCEEGTLAVVERSARESESPWGPWEHEATEADLQAASSDLVWQPWDERRYGETALWYGRCVRLH